MFPVRRWLWFLMLLGLVLLAACGPGLRSAWLPGAGQPKDNSFTQTVYDSLAFVPNAGQTDGQVRFLVQAISGNLFFTDDSIVLARPGPALQPADLKQTEGISFQTVRIKFDHANSEVFLTGLAPLPGRVNYFLGGDRTAWTTDLPAYAGIQYHELYPGINLQIESRRPGSNSTLDVKGTYIVKPGADPRQIRWRYDGAADVQLDQSGNLEIILPTFEADPTKALYGASVLREHAPVAWQEIDGARMPVKVAYKLFADDGIGFEVGAYRPDLPLWIDPELEYSTYIGGTGLDEGFDVAVDSAKNVYLIGATLSVDFPSEFSLTENQVGSRNIFVAKLSRDGASLDYSTFLGGSGEEVGRSITTDTLGDVYITGTTTSEDFPATFPAKAPEASGANIFVAKMSVSGGALRYSTVIGGSGEDSGLGVAVDSIGNAVVVGATESEDFPTVGPLQPRPAGGETDGVVLRLNSNGSELLYSSYLGGGGEDAANAVAIDRDGSTYITGYTASENFPVIEPYQDELIGSPDTFVVKLEPELTGYVYSTFVTIGSGSEGNAIYVDRGGNAHLAGTITVPDAVAGDEDLLFFGGSDAFAMKLNPAGDTLLYKTSLGGSEDEEGLGITVDREGVTFITGSTDSPNLPIDGSIQDGYAGKGDAFVVQLGQSGNVVTYNYIGGSDLDVGQSIAVAGTGDAVVAGITFSADFPVVRAMHSGYSGEGDAFVLKLKNVEFVPTPPPTETPPATPLPPTATPEPPPYVGIVQSDMFLFGIYGLIGLTVLMFIAEIIRNWWKRRRKQKGGGLEL